MKKATYYYSTACLECKDVQFGFGDKTLATFVYDYKCDACGSATTVLYETENKDEARFKDLAIQAWQDTNAVIDTENQEK